MEIYTTTDTELFLECLFGKPQHDSHMRAWRWDQYTGGAAGSAMRDAALQAELAKMAGECRARAHV